jgi:hypothetical protein
MNFDPIEFAKGVGDFVRDSLRIRDERIKELERRLGEIEAKGVVYRGVYQRADEYKRGDMVTFKGSVWHANHDTREEPGASEVWQLAVRAGRDKQ